MSTIYASFGSPSDAERAAGAMLDHGALPEDLSLLANERNAAGQPIAKTGDVLKAEQSAKSGISTTTAFDVAAGTIKGATIGIGVGTLAALASLFIPGLGLVLGGGAFATAIMGGAGTVIASAAVGGVAGFLADQGIPDDVVTRYSKAFEAGGAILAIAVPSGNLDATDAEALLVKYGAENIATVNAPRALVEGAAVPAPDPLVIQNPNPEIAPAAYIPDNAVITSVVDPLDATTPIVKPVRPPEDLAPTMTPTQPTPEPLVDIIDPESGQIFRRPVETVVPVAESSQMTTLTPNSEVVEDRAGQYHQTVGKPVVISEQPVVVTDPVTGAKKPARVVEEQHAVVKDPANVDPEGHAIMPIDGPEQTVITREKHIEYPE